MVLRPENKTFLVKKSNKFDQENQFGTWKNER